MRCWLSVDVRVGVQRDDGVAAIDRWMSVGWSSGGRRQSPRGEGGVAPALPRAAWPSHDVRLL